MSFLKRIFKTKSKGKRRFIRFDQYLFCVFNPHSLSFLSLAKHHHHVVHPSGSISSTLPGVRSQFSDYDCDPTIIPIKDWDVVLFSVWLQTIEGVSPSTIEKLKEEEWDGKSLLYFSKNVGSSFSFIC